MIIHKLKTGKLKTAIFFYIMIELLYLRIQKRLIQQPMTYQKQWKKETQFLRISLSILSEILFLMKDGTTHILESILAKEAKTLEECHGKFLDILQCPSQSH